MSLTEARVLENLRNHPHHDTPQALSALLADLDVEQLTEALRSLAGRGLLLHAAGHWQPTWRGWQAATGAPADPYRFAA